MKKLYLKDIINQNEELCPEGLTFLNLNLYIRKMKKYVPKVYSTK